MKIDVHCETDDGGMTLCDTRTSARSLPRTPREDFELLLKSHRGGDLCQRCRAILTDGETESIFNLPERGVVCMTRDLHVVDTDLQRFADAGGTVSLNGFRLYIHARKDAHGSRT